MTTLNEPLKNHLIKRIILQSIRWPVFYLIAGVLLGAFSYIDIYFNFDTKWNKLFLWADKLGLAFIIMAGVLFFYNLLRISCLFWERKLLEKHNTASLILNRIRKTFNIIFTLVTINIFIVFLAPSKFYFNIANNLINTILIGSIGWIALQVLYTFEAVIYQKMISLNNEKYLQIKELYTKIHILRNIASILIVAVTVSAILMSFNSVKPIGISILASAGFLTAIVGLASQKALSSLFAGLQIALSQPIKIGDIVVVENTTGVIEEITLTNVMLKIGDQRRLLVPISFFIEKPFENWTRQGDSLFANIPLFVDYMQPIQPLRDELTRVLKKSKFWDGNANKIEVANITERAVELTLKLSAANGDDIGNLRAEIREKMLEFIRLNFADHFPKIRVHGNSLNSLES